MTNMKQLHEVAFDAQVTKNVCITMHVTLCLMSNHAKQQSGNSAAKSADLTP